ncbi:MAG TPA: TPM domain-containing protein [Usitatibacteraceae bacterium]|nr:TPM domain-containing protein [Usitatibacteraceae bacterium]
MTRIAGRLLAGAAASFFVAFAALAADVTEPIPVPKLTGRVIDLTATLAAPESEAIAARLKAFEAAKGSQVAVLMVPAIGTETIEEFATRVTDEWKLGRAGVDDGVLFVIAKQERRMRIQTGRGVQGVLTDALSRRIIAERVSPRFRAGDFAGGISDGVDAIMKAIEGESLPPPAQAPSRGKVDSFSSIENFFWLAFVVVPVVGMILRSLVGRFLGAGLTSGVTGLAAWVIFGSLLLGGIAAVITFLAVLFMGTSALGARRGGIGGGPWGGGGWSGGGGGGFGGGGGGFSGGGGGFDGGGASGNW